MKNGKPTVKDQPAQGNEFPEGAEMLDPGFSRRDWLQLMGASLGLAGLGVGCRRPEEVILPFGKQPEGYVHGVPEYFATARPTRTGAVPLVVESNEGRPTKVEGNAEHPDSNGGTDLHTQASILDLYDPDRAQQFKVDGAPSTKADAMVAVGELSHDKIAFLLEPGTSPSRARMLAAVHSKHQNAGFYTYDPLEQDVHQQAAEAVFGKAVRPRYRFDKADVILSLD